jgi:hypothetical protein
LRETFLQQLKQLMEQADVDIWFADESGFEGDPRPRKRWDKRGRKTRVTQNGGHLRMNVIGMVCPRSGQFFAIEASDSDSATFQAFEEQLIERLDQSILDVINNPKKTQQKDCWFAQFMSNSKKGIHKLFDCSTHWLFNELAKILPDRLKRLCPKFCS